MFKNEEGFSLLELVVAVGVAGIIAAVALPTFAGLQDKATTTSATYAASASAAEALANSTIGTTGGNGSASTTGGASSSAAASSQTVNSSSLTLSSVELGSSAYLDELNDNQIYYVYDMAAHAGQSSSNMWDLITSGPLAYAHNIDLVVIGGLDQTTAMQIANAANNGATSISMMGYTWQLTTLPVPVYDPITGLYTARESTHTGAQQSMYGGPWSVAFHVTGVSAQARYPSLTYFGMN